MNNQLMDILNQLSKVDYGILIQIFMPMLSYCIPNKVISTYTLHKDFKPKDISKVSVPPELKQKYTSVEISQIGSKKIREATLEFANLMVEKFSSTSLTNFYNNINEVKIKRNVGILILALGGKFSSKSNQITVADLSAIYHELFHMASSYYDENSKVAYVGFSQYSYGYNISNPIDIGTGINEGYTELLTKRYFGEKCKMSKSYKYAVSVVDKLEKIIGQEKMETLYLNANLPGLINELMKYASEDEIAKFITGVDLITRHSDDIFIFKNKKIKRSIVDVSDFLIKTYMVKLKQQLDNGIINVNEFIQHSTQFIQSLGTSVKIGGHNYEVLTVDNLLENWKRITDVSQLSSNMQDVDSSFKR